MQGLWSSVLRGPNPGTTRLNNYTITRIFIAIYEAWNTLMEHTPNYLLLKQKEHNVLTADVRNPAKV